MVKGVPLAVERLIAKRNRVCCMTGRSAGLLPLSDARGVDAGLLPLSSTRRRDSSRLRHPVPTVDIRNALSGLFFHSRLGIDITRALGATR